MTSIFQIDQELQEFFQNLPETGEISDQDLELLEKLQLSKKQKQQNIIRYYKSLNAQINIIDDEMQRLKELKETTKKNAEKMANLLEYSMRQDGTPELDFVTDKAKFKKKISDLDIYDESQLPKKFIKVTETKSVNRKYLRECLANGEIAGARLIPAERLEIK